MGILFKFGNSSGSGPACLRTTGRFPGLVDFQDSPLYQFRLAPIHQDFYLRIFTLVVIYSFLIQTFDKNQNTTY